MYRVERPDFTERQAAEEFARAVYEDRKVSTWCVNPTQFQLVGGARWYRVIMLPDYSGWGIETVNGSAI